MSRHLAHLCRLILQRTPAFVSALRSNPAGAVVPGGLDAARSGLLPGWRCASLSAGDPDRSARMMKRSLLRPDPLFGLEPEPCFAPC